MSKNTDAAILLLLAEEHSQVLELREAIADAGAEIRNQAVALSAKDEEITDLRGRVASLTAQIQEMSATVKRKSATGASTGSGKE